MGGNNILVTARFKGLSWSMGFCKGNVYRLRFWIKKDTVQIQNRDGNQFCIYASLSAFQANWEVLK